MSQVVIPLERRGFGETMRRDAWWRQPLVALLVLGAWNGCVRFLGRHPQIRPASDERTEIEMLE